MIAADFDECLCGQATLLNELLGVGKRDHIVQAAMQDNRVGLQSIGRSPVLPRWTQEHQRCTAAVQVHRYRTAARTADNHIGTRALILCLSNMQSSRKVVVIQGWVEHFMSSRLEIGWLDATHHATPSCKKRIFKGIGFRP